MRRVRKSLNLAQAVTSKQYGYALKAKDGSPEQHVQ